MKTVYVKDFVNINSTDVFNEVIQAIKELKTTNADVLEFDAGEYNFISTYPVTTDQTAHDLSARYQPQKEVHIPLIDLENVTIKGQVDTDGNPTTTLIGLNDGKLHDLLPSILWLDGGKNIVVENFNFKRSIDYCSCGEIVDICDNNVTVKVFDGNPCYDGMGTYCMNRFSADKTTLVGESLSYGNGLGVTFKKIGENLLKLSHEQIAKTLKIGEVITFHQGAQTDFQCFYGNVENLTLKNLRTFNSNGFCSLAFNVNNLTIDKVKFMPQGNQLFTAPRDAFKLYKCQGDVVVNQMHVQGVRMDGQNVHGNYMEMLDKIDENTARFFTPYSYLPLPTNSKIVAYTNTLQHTLLSIDVIHEKCGEHNNKYGQFFTIRFSQALPDNVDTSCLFLPIDWELKSYKCTNSEFRNVAGAGHLIRVGNVQISNCSYTNMMNAGIIFGCEIPYHFEGGNCENLVIQNCTFTNCGFKTRNNANGCIGFCSYGSNKQSIKIENAKIIGCKFNDSTIGIDVKDTSSLEITDCTFNQIKKRIEINWSSCKKVIVDEFSR